MAFGNQIQHHGKRQKPAASMPVKSPNMTPAPITYAAARSDDNQREAGPCPRSLGMHTTLGEVIQSCSTVVDRCSLSSRWRRLA
jgi:hypothetical protein